VIEKLPSPIALQFTPELPNAPTPKASAIIPADDLKPLYDFGIDCKACQAKLATVQSDLADERQKSAALTRERGRQSHPLTRTKLSKDQAASPLLRSENGAWIRDKPPAP
jgi:hypothetical protein